MHLETENKAKNRTEQKEAALNLIAHPLAILPLNYSPPAFFSPFSPLLDSS